MPNKRPVTGQNLDLDLMTAAAMNLGMPVHAVGTVHPDSLPLIVLVAVGDDARRVLGALKREWPRTAALGDAPARPPYLEN